MKSVIAELAVRLGRAFRPTVKEETSPVVTKHKQTDAERVAWMRAATSRHFGDSAECRRQKRRNWRASKGVAS